MNGGTRRVASAALGVAAAASAIWYFRQVALVARGKTDAWLVAPGIVAAACTMLALYLWASAKSDE